ncbi:hypothetical protein [Streptomyces varsoviensis]|uniref:hypothetical protein n=1 Tax=Streptomyces varsoviensis TaxID=67373 RepID=UPI003F4D3900
MSATASLAVTHLVPLAASDLDKNKVTPGVLGFIVFAVIGGAVWLLMKSMNKHMKKVDFEEPGAGGTTTPPGEPGTAHSAADSAAPAAPAPKGGPAKREATTPTKGPKGTAKGATA